MNNLQKCIKGHQFDPKQHSRCPFCGIADGATPKHANSPQDDIPTRKNDETSKTEAYDKKRPGAHPADADVTVAVWSKEIGIDPVVGWLVCVAGNSKGRDYRIRSGLNNIGRETSNTICLAADETISRTDHCTIFYDPKSITFHISPGIGRSGVYINEKIVLQPTQINSKDIIGIGQTKLEFVAFVGEHFHWEMPV